MQQHEEKLYLLLLTHFTDLPCFWHAHTSDGHNQYNIPVMRCCSPIIMIQVGQLRLLGIEKVKFVHFFGLFEVCSASFWVQIIVCSHVIFVVVCFTLGPAGELKRRQRQMRRWGCFCYQDDGDMLCLKDEKFANFCNSIEIMRKREIHTYCLFYIENGRWQ